MRLTGAGFADDDGPQRIQSVRAFAQQIGFLQHYKVKDLEQACIRIKSTRPRHGKTTYDITEVEYLGDEEVFDIIVDDPDHTYWTGGLLVSNCTEFTSETDSDRCNLGTLWINRFDSAEEWGRAVEVATAFLLNGSKVADYPDERIAAVGRQNNRVGLAGHLPPLVKVEP